MAEDFYVQGMSKVEIEIEAISLLKKFLPDTISRDFVPLDVERLLDTFLFEHSGYALAIVEDSKLDSDIEAQTTFSTKIIELRQSDYDKLAEPSRSRFTACHEVGHAILHTDQLNKYTTIESKELKLFRKRENIPIYARADWQANVFASAILMPFPSAKRLLISGEAEGYSFNSIAQLFSEKFLVSLEAAEVRISTIKEYLSEKEARLSV